MPSDLPKNILKLVAALLKHQAKLWLGDEAVGIAGETLIEIGGEEIEKKLDDLLSTKRGEAELLKAAQRANEYFQQNCTDDHLRQAFTLAFGDLTSVQEALAELPTAMDTSQVEDAIQTALLRDVPKLTPAQAKQGARLYTEGLQRALLPAKDFTLPIIGQTVLDNKNKLIELGYDQKEILVILKRIELQLAQPPATPISVPAPPGSLPIGSYLPFARNALFTGRENDLQSLADNLLKDNPTSTVISQSVTGMGGIGKTQLAVEFAWRYGYRFQGVHWLDLRDAQALDGAIALCGIHMGYAHANQREQVAATLQTWIADGPRLLILDNFEEITQSIDVLVRFQHLSMRLLVTSRRKDFPKSVGLHVQELGLFSESESLDFLEKTLEKAETSTARMALAEKLGHLPLALELAANYIKITKIGIENYLKELKELVDILKHESMQAEWFQELEVTNPTKHDRSLFATFQLSWREVKDEMQQKILMVAGYCAPNTPIPLEIFKATLELEDKALSKALYRLNALGLLPTANRLPSIHPLLGSYARTLAASSKDLLAKLAGELAGLARQANDHVDQTGSLRWFVPLHSHLLSTAEFAEEADLPDVATLLGNLGYYLAKIADYQGAKSAYQRAIKILEQQIGSNHSRVAIYINNLGLVLKESGDLMGAEAAYERALKINEAAFGPDHPDVARNINNLGMALKDRGDLVGAKAAFERALKIWEASFGLDHPQVATGINNLGGVLHDLGDLAGAKAAFERALKIDEAAFGPDHPHALADAGNLGLVLLDLGNLMGAKAAFEHALEIDEATFGPDHVEVAKDVNNLGLVLQDLGDLAGAKAAFERALKIDEAAFGPDHSKVALRLNNLGTVLQDLGDLRGAKAAFERALKIREKSFGKEHPDVALSLRWLGVLAQEEGNKEIAEDFYKRALQMYQKFLPPDHPDIKSLQNHLNSLE